MAGQVTPRRASRKPPRSHHAAPVNLPAASLRQTPVSSSPSSAIRTGTRVMRLRDMSFGRKLTAAFALLVALAAAVGGTAWHQSGQVEQGTRWTTHTYKVIAAVEQVVNGAVDQETGLRAFLLAGEARSLEPYRGGAERAHAALAEAKRLTADNPTQQRRLEELGRLVETWRSAHADPA